MSFQIDIIQKFQINPAHAKHCEQCFRATVSREFWIWDPKNDADPPYSPEELSELPKKTPRSSDLDKRLFACLLLAPTPRQKKESLEVTCKSVIERTFVALDKCLIAEGIKCEGLIFFGENKALKLVWVEMKMNMNRKNPKPKTLSDRILGEEDDGAFNQILKARNFFINKGLDVTRFQNIGHVGIPKELELLSKKSNAIKKRIVELRKFITFQVGSTLQLP